MWKFPAPGAPVHLFSLIAHAHWALREETGPLASGVSPLCGHLTCVCVHLSRELTLQSSKTSELHLPHFQLIKLSRDLLRNWNLFIALTSSYHISSFPAVGVIVQGGFPSGLRPKVHPCPGLHPYLLSQERQDISYCPAHSWTSPAFSQWGPYYKSLY